MRSSLHVRRGSLALGLSLGFAVSWAATAEPAWQYPVIRGYGKVRPLPEAAVQPNPDREYKVLFSITTAAESPGQLNPGLKRIARLINIFGIAKVPSEKLKIMAVIHGSATPIVLDDQHYRQKFKLDNLNSKLIHELKQAGAIIYVYGQALAHKGCAPSVVNQEVSVALAALTGLSIYQLDGYALIPE